MLREATTVSDSTDEEKQSCATTKCIVNNKSNMIIDCVSIKKCASINGLFCAVPTENFGFYLSTATLSQVIQLLYPKDP